LRSGCWLHDTTAAGGGSHRLILHRPIVLLVFGPGQTGWPPVRAEPEGGVAGDRFRMTAAAPPPGGPRPPTRSA
jgi:hypothetical protein